MNGQYLATQFRAIGCADVRRRIIRVSGIDANDALRASAHPIGSASYRVRRVFFATAKRQFKSRMADCLATNPPYGLRPYICDWRGEMVSTR